MFTQSKLPSYEEIVHNHVIKSVADTEHKISRLRFNKTAVKSRLVLALFEQHTHSILTLNLASTLMEKFQIGLVALEFPITRTGNLEAKDYDGDMTEDGKLDKKYKKSLKNFCNNAEKNNIDVVCIDEHEVDSLPEFENYMEHCVEEKRFDPDQATDFIRNDIMAHTLYHFTTAKKVITINGAVHYSDLITKLMKIDESGICIALLLLTDHSLKYPTMRYVQELNQNLTFHRFHVTVPDQKSALPDNFVSQLVATMNELITQLQNNQSIARDLSSNVNTQTSSSSHAIHPGVLELNGRQEPVSMFFSPKEPIRGRDITLLEYMNDQDNRRIFSNNRR